MMPKPLTLSDDRRMALTGHLKTLFATEFDETLSDFRAGEIIDLMLSKLGPAVYNQAIQDVRGHLQTTVDDLTGDVWRDDPL